MSFCFKLNKLNGTPNLLLNDFGEYVTLQIFLRVLPINSFKEVLPQLPVIAMILLDVFSLIIEEALVKNFREFFTLICLGLLLNLLTTAKDAPLLKASFVNRLLSFFLPLTAKKTSFFFISLELIDALLIFVFKEILLKLLN